MGPCPQNVPRDAQSPTHFALKPYDCSKSNCFYVKSVPNALKLEMGTLLDTHETHMFATHTCFSVFFAGSPEGKSMGGGKGVGLINPPLRKI